MPVSQTRVKTLQAPRRIRSYLAATADRPVLMIAASEEAAARYARDARAFVEGAVHLPSRGPVYGDVFGPGIRRVGERQRALHKLGEARLVFAGPYALRERTPLHDPLRIAPERELEMEAALRRLAGLGYERTDRVSRHGEFAVRGGIVDLFPSTRRSPVRVEWWGDEVESVRAVSLATQRAIRDL